MNIDTFLDHYPFVFILNTTDNILLGEFIKSKIGNCNLSIDVPNRNISETLIIVPSKLNTLRKLHYDELINMNYEKFPSKIIVLLSFETFLKIDGIIDEMLQLSMYKIPILYCNIMESNINYSFNLLPIEFYKDSSKYFLESLHITDMSILKNSLGITNEKKSIYLYYHNEDEREIFENKIESLNYMILYLKSLSKNKKLTYLNNKLLII